MLCSLAQCYVDSPRSCVGLPAAAADKQTTLPVHEAPRLRMAHVLRPVLCNTQLLWELMLLAEPVAVSSPSPALCSAVVLALTK